MQGMISALKDIARNNREIRGAAMGDLTRFVSLRQALDGACNQFLACLGPRMTTGNHLAVFIRLHDQFSQMRRMLADHQRGWTLAEVICLPEDYADSATRVNEQINHFVETSLRLLATVERAAPRHQAA